MVINYCNKCETHGALKLENRGTHTALVCENCKSWLKWVGKKELPMYESLLLKKDNKSSLDKFEKNLKNAISDLGISKNEVVKILDRIYG